MQLDNAGKASFDHIYTEPDPRAYFATLRAFDYCIPQLAKPHFARLLAEYRRQRAEPVLKVLDIGCSYGINAALLKCDATMDELYERYCDGDAADRSRADLVSRDKELLRTRADATDIRFVGLDASQPALAYARAAGFLDDAVHADLESRDPTPAERRRISPVDLVISTGCLGYVTERTVGRIAAANSERLPWMAHFVLRMFPFEPVAETLAEFGYETVRPAGLFRQRRFASAEEKERTLDRLAEIGVDPAGLEADGWLYAQLHVSRPAPAGGRGPSPRTERRNAHVT